VHCVFKLFLENRLEQIFIDPGNQSLLISLSSVSTLNLSAGCRGLEEYLPENLIFWCDRTTAGLFGRT
jgi:hypothetical protein